MDFCDRSKKARKVRERSSRNNTSNHRRRQPQSLTLSTGLLSAVLLTASSLMPWAMATIRSRSTAAAAIGRHVFAILCAQYLYKDLETVELGDERCFKPSNSAQVEWNNSGSVSVKSCGLCCLKNHLTLRRPYILDTYTADTQLWSRAPARAHPVIGVLMSAAKGLT